MNIQGKNCLIRFAGKKRQKNFFAAELNKIKEIISKNNHIIYEYKTNRRPRVHQSTNINNFDPVYPNKSEWYKIIRETNKIGQDIWIEIFDNQISDNLERFKNSIKGIIINPKYKRSPKVYSFLNTFNYEILIKCDDLKMIEIISLLEIFKEREIKLFYKVNNFIINVKKNRKFDNKKFNYIKKIFPKSKFNFYSHSNIFNAIIKKNKYTNMNNLFFINTIALPKINKKIINLEKKKSRKLFYNLSTRNQRKIKLEKNRIGLFCQARISSTRLKKKALLPFYKDNNTIGYLLKRLKSYQNFIGQIVLATSNQSSDDALVLVAKKYNIKIFRGDLKDVVNRMITCADYFNWHTVVRVTGDDQFISCEYIEKCLKHHIQNNFDYTKSVGLPLGLNCEIIKIDTLKKIKKYLVSKENPEHITYYLDSDMNCRNGLIKAHKKQSYGQYRLTLDYKEDYELMKQLAHVCHTKYGDKYITTDRLIGELLKLNPTWKHNENLWPVYRNEINSQIQFS